MWWVLHLLPWSPFPVRNGSSYHLLHERRHKNGLCVYGELSIKGANCWLQSTLIQYQVHHDQQTFDGLVCDSTLQEPIFKANSVCMHREESSNVYQHQTLSHTCCSPSYHNVATKGHRHRGFLQIHWLKAQNQPCWWICTTHVDKGGHHIKK